MSIRRRQAFTMLELLVVISIIAVLATMTIVGATALIGDAKKKKTQTILSAIRKGIELTIAARGGSISPVEHPLAGSRAPRFQYQRYNAPTGSGTSMPPAGVQLDTSSIALAGLNDPSQLPGGGSAAGNQLMLASDLYADKRSYLLYGLKREYIGVLGALQKRVTKYILLPKPLQGQLTLSAAIYSPLTTTQLPQYTIPTDVQDGDPTFGHPSANKQAIDYVFGSSNVQTELAGLKALYMADPTTYANSAGSGAGAGSSLASTSNAFRYPINYQTVSSDSSPDLVLGYTDGHAVANWKPGCISLQGGVLTVNDTDVGGGTWIVTTPGGGKWLHYRLPGLAIYDAWGVEILYSISSQGGIRLMSAGADGVFQFQPGPTNLINSTDPEMGPSGGDKDGSKDNVVERVEEQQ